MTLHQVSMGGGVLSCLSSRFNTCYGVNCVPDTCSLLTTGHDHDRRLEVLHGNGAKPIPDYFSATISNNAVLKNESV